MRIRPRTAISLGVVAVLVVGIGTAVVVNANKGDGGSSGSVVWWVPDWDMPTAQTIVDKFHQETGIDVQISTVTGDTIVQKVSVAFDSGDTPDLLTDSIARVPTYVADGELADLSDLYTSDLPKDDFVPGVLDAVSVEQKVYAVPYRWASNALIYNKGLFDKEGLKVPTTYAEFEDTAKKLEALGVDGTAWPMKGDQSDLTLRFLEAALSSGATITDGKPALTEASVKSALQVLGSSIADGWASKSSFEVDNTAIRELFLQGRVGMYPGGVFDVDTAKQQAGFEVGSALLPGLDGPGTAQAVGWAHVVPAAAKNPEGAKKLAAFLGRPENMAALTLTFPARISAGQDPKFQTPERAAFVEQLNGHSVPAADDPAWIAMIPQVYDTIQSVALGKTSVDDGTATIMQLAQDKLG